MGEENKDVAAEKQPAAQEEAKEGNSYVIRPNFQHKFRPVMVKEMIHLVVTEELSGKTYDSENTTEWTKKISDTIKDKLQEMGYDRYKFIVQVVIAEQRGQGTKMACRCFWDADSDNYAQDLYMNESLVCVAAAFGVFHY
ncbi:dynein light chain Tctex-type protein 2B-like [Littorina saxatilis]|uniref:Tctex1 domain-containing protein 2 n=1 Tax=Littorina saxatilis TaxID=31220 RepID=A0AAN9ANY0_9CAEN|eukprot:GHVL01033174.1.p1 GENE.GHVL01033174.1~~GHVL01033174.1.p1  ORF type:complete len:140 (+),score=17.66 GHVL01033174.1:69-488(+)